MSQTAPYIFHGADVSYFSGAHPPEPDPLRERVSEPVPVRQAVLASPILCRRLVRQAAVRTGVVVALPPSVQRLLGVLETRKPML